MSASSLASSAARLAEQGFDLCQAFGTDDYNTSASAQSHDFRLPSFGRPSALAWVVGHTKALWPPFAREYEQSPELKASEHPLNTYTELAIDEVRRASRAACIAFFSHAAQAPIPIQRIAHVARLAELSPSHLSVHPTAGPWLGLRAVVVFDLEPVLEPPAQRFSHCCTCPKPCLAALEAALKPPDTAQGPPWRRWLAVRDSCPVGTEARYSPNQIRYHYTKDRSALSGPAINTGQDRDSA